MLNTKHPSQGIHQASDKTLKLKFHKLMVVFNFVCESKILEK